MAKWNTPERLFMETKWASFVSYSLTAQPLTDFLPMDDRLHDQTVRNHTLAVAQRCEAELGEEQWTFIHGCQADWDCLPPDGPITVGIDGGYVRDWQEKQRHFEVITGKSLLTLETAIVAVVARVGARFAKRPAPRGA